MTGEIRIPIRTDKDIVRARHEGRTLAHRLGFEGTDLTLISTAISELARNILSYAVTGEIVITPAQHGNQKGIMVVADDLGPGIPDIERALEDGYSTGGSLGVGLPGTKRLMDEFHIRSENGKGTTVTVKKWLDVFQ